MGQQESKSLAKRAQGSTPTNSEQQLAYAPPRELFGTSIALSKPKAIVAALTRLAALIHANQDEPLLIALAELLSDMAPRALQLAFEHLEHTHQDPWLPSPAQIRALGEQLHKAEIGENYRRGLAEQTAAENRRFAERVAAGEDEYYGLADLAKIAREKYNMKVGDDKENRETQKAETDADAAKAREVQATKVALHKAGKL